MLLISIKRNVTNKDTMALRVKHCNIRLFCLFMPFKKNTQRVFDIGKFAM